MKLFFNRLQVSWHSLVHSDGTSFSVKDDKGLTIPEKQCADFL